MVLLVGDLIAPSGRGSSVSSESEGRDFSHANDGDRVEVRILALRRVYDVAEKALPFDTAVRSEVVLQWARNKRGKVAEE